MTGADRISLGRVLAAVDLDDQLVPEAQEVGDVRADGSLTPKFRIRKGFSQRSPEALFGVGGIAAKTTGAIDRS